MGMMAHFVSAPIHAVSWPMDVWEVIHHKSTVFRSTILATYVLPVPLPISWNAKILKKFKVGMQGVLHGSCSLTPISCSDIHMRTDQCILLNKHAFSFIDSLQ